MRRGGRTKLGKFGQPLSSYDTFMEANGIPIFRGIGISKVQNLLLADWPRMGGRRIVHPVAWDRGQVGQLRGRGARGGRAEG